MSLARAGEDPVPGAGRGAISGAAAAAGAGAAGAALRALKARLRGALGIDPQSGVTPLPGLRWIGSQTHGYMVPDGLLHAGSVCYCVGAGEDITFDTELAVQFGCEVRILDPTPVGTRHYAELLRCVRAGEPLSSRNGEPFRYRIAPAQLGLLRYLEIGVWDRAATLRFNEPVRDDYPSYSVTMFQESGRWIEAPVDRLAAIMRREGDAAIDLLKLEIEGAEYRVLETVIEDRLDVQAIVVEFDEVWHAKGRSRAHLFRIRDASRALQRAGWRLVHSTPMFKRTFVREEACARLGARLVTGPDSGLSPRPAASPPSSLPPPGRSAAARPGTAPHS